MDLKSGMGLARWRRLACAISLAWGVGPAGAQTAVSSAPAPASNPFNDPFVQLTQGPLPCPTPVGPLYTAAEVREQAHQRAERGTTCYRMGHCRLPNSYLYDADIIARVQRAVAGSGAFEADTRIWAYGQRRWVFLQGCVRSAAQAQAIEQLVNQLDDVQAVVNELVTLP